MARQLTLFGEEVIRPRRQKPGGGSANPIIFRDYESFVAKFGDSPKTTDDCYTPQDVYEAVVRYVSTITDMSDKVILRPFYPGGDYLNAEYPEDGIVIDNPPFSMFTKICKWYTQNEVPFFLFGPGLTISSCCKYCTAVIINESVTFANGANVRLNFASNLYGDTMMTTAPELGRMIALCPSQQHKKPLPSFTYPQEVLSVSDMQTIARNGITFSVSRNEARIIRDLDRHPKKGGLFGDHLLISTAKAQEKEKAKSMKSTGEKVTTPIHLSEREKKIVERMNKSNGKNGFKEGPGMGDHTRTGAKQEQQLSCCPRFGGRTSHHQERESEELRAELRPTMHGVPGQGDK